MTSHAQLTTHMQQLRDWAERASRAWAAQGNAQDAADAWERIGLALDECARSIASDWRVLDATNRSFCPLPRDRGMIGVTQEIPR